MERRLGRSSLHYWNICRIAKMTVPPTEIIQSMNRGVPELNVVVVPDSGTDQLKGLTGKMEIVITSGKHFYNFEYRLPDGQ